MNTSQLNLTIDATGALSSIELLNSVLKTFNASFDLLNTLLEVIGFKFDASATTVAGNCHVILDVSDSFRDFILALRAGDIE